LRRRALGARLGELGADALLITEPIHVRYLTGFTGSNAQVLVSADGSSIFLTDGRYTEQSSWEVPDLERRTYPRSYREELARISGELGVGRLGFESTHLTVAEHARLDEVTVDVTMVPAEGVVEALRTVKDDEELDLIRDAQSATDATFERVLDLLSIGVTEEQIARAIEAILLEEGADDSAFSPIVAFGENAAEPHHGPGHRQLEEGDVIVLDFGGLVGGYHSDMTRTVAFGTPAPELRKVHDVVREAQQAGMDAALAGATGDRVDAAARSVIEDAGYGDRFVHGLGHGVGLEIHEAPWLGRSRDEELPVGAAVTVEPGVYLPGVGGVRIEDIVEIGDDGPRVVGISSRDLIEI
jgi:Xaa-Pro aminopeptidase